MTRVVDKISTCQTVREEINYLNFYFNFMTSFVQLMTKLFNKYFMPTYENKTEFILKSCWLTFVFLKKINLKRKNDKIDCLVLMCAVLDEIRLMTKKGHVTSSFDLIYKDALDFFSIPENDKSSLEGIKTGVKEKIKEIYFNYENTKTKYEEILIAGEFDDLLIFENYFIERKINSCPKYNEVINSYPSSSESTAKNSLSSPINVESRNCKINSFENFFSSLKDFNCLDMTFFNKFPTFGLATFNHNYNFYFDIYFKQFISVYLKKSLENLEFNYSHHKNLFLKLAEDIIITNNKISISALGEDNFDDNFFFNLLILSFHIFLNLLYVEKQNLILQINFLLCENLNKFEKFDFLKTVKIINILLRLGLPANIAKLIKTLLNSLITYVIWQNDSFYFKLKAEELDENMKIGLKFLSRKVYIHLASCIYKISKKMDLDSKVTEEIWKVMKNVLSEQQNYLIDSSLETLLINVVSKVLIKNYNNKNRNSSYLSNLSNYDSEFVSDLEESNFSKSNTSNVSKNKSYEVNDILCIFHDIKKSINSELFDFICEKSNTNFLKNDMTYLEDKINLEYFQREEDLEEKASNKQNVNNSLASLFSINSKFSSFIPYLQEEFNVIHTISPTQNNNLENQEFLGNKRIRALTPPASTKILTVSPYNRKSSFTPYVNTGTGAVSVSAFKNLNTVFSSMSKGI